MVLNLENLEKEIKRRPKPEREPARRSLAAAVAAVAPSVRVLRLKLVPGGVDDDGEYDENGPGGISQLPLPTLLAPLAPHVRRLEVEEDMGAELVEVALLHALFSNGDIWNVDLGGVAPQQTLERQLELPGMEQLLPKIVQLDISECREGVGISSVAWDA